MATGIARRVVSEDAGVPAGRKISRREGWLAR
jgi:hypothetical protein